MTRLFLIAALGLCLVAGIARADDAATEQLVQELQAIGQLQGTFQQRQYGGDSDAVVAVSSGSFRLLRPGYFAWEISSPDQQLIIADLEYLWHYDLDLETVTRRPVQGREEMSPLQVLGGDANVLRERFEVSIDGERGYILLPSQGNPGFASLRLELAEGSLAGMEIMDNLNQRIEIQFQDVDNRSSLTPSDFEFTPPEGVDLFTYDQ
jgi:outer membrane lipoprotein carrier protein